MNTQWRQLICKILFWLLLEAIFNSIGVDTIADYSEFLLMPKIICQQSTDNSYDFGVRANCCKRYS